MRIYFFIKDMSLTGGTERVCQNLSNLFISKGHTVTIVSYNREKQTETYRPTDAVRIVYLSNKRYPDDRGYFQRIKSIWESVLKLKKFFREDSIDDKCVLISQSLSSNIALWLAGKAGKTIGCEHFKYDLYSKPIRAIRCLIYSSFRNIVLLTEKDKARFALHLSSKKLHVIPNMLVVNESIVYDIESRIIIAVGRLHRQKGYDMLIKAMKPVARKHPDWLLYIYGEGDLKECLQKQINDYGLSKNVFLKGFSSNIVSAFELSSFFVLSSRYEGYPMVLLEALGMGMPSIAFDCPEGPSELLRDGGGILVERENITELSNAIIYMIENPEYRIMCTSHKEFIRKNLSPDVIYTKWMELFMKS